MTRKPQIAWCLRAEDARGHYVALWSIYPTREEAEERFWTEHVNYIRHSTAVSERRFRDGTYRFVKVQIIPVEGEDG